MADAGIRLVGSITVAVPLFLFVIFWELGSMNTLGPYWLGTLVYAPLLAYILSFCAALFIQYIDCKKVKATELATAAIRVPMLYYLFALILWAMPGLRYPIEGMMMNYDLLTRRAVSSGVYTILMSMIAQEMVNGVAVRCD